MGELIEAWSRTTRRLGPEQAQMVAQTKLASVELHEPPDSWWLVTDSRIGVVDWGAWSLRVVPRLAVPKLMFLLGYAADPRGWKDSIASFGRDRDLFSAIASGFAYHAHRALEPAPIRGYVSIDEQSFALRGRLRVGDQIARTMPLPLEVTYDEYTLDVAENRMLRGATEILLRFWRVPQAARNRLLRVRAILEEVAPETHATSAPPKTRLNERYEPALKLAELILSAGSITTHKGNVPSVGFVFDMNKVFEDFLTAALTESLRSHGGVVSAQHKGHTLDHERHLRLIPDLTWTQGGALRAVIDAKYKRLDVEGIPNADAYQMLGYCTAFDLLEGYLVYARDEQLETRSHRIRNSQVTLKVRAIDVERQPDAVLDQVGELACEIASDVLMPA